MTDNVTLTPAPAGTKRAAWIVARHGGMHWAISTTIGEHTLWSPICDSAKNPWRADQVHELGRRPRLPNVCVRCRKRLRITKPHARQGSLFDNQPTQEKGDGNMTTRPTDKEVEDLCNAFVRDNPAMFREHTITFAVKLGNGEVAHTTPPRPAPYRIMGVKFFDPRAQPLTKAQIDFVSLVSLHFGQVLPFGVEGALPIAVLNDALPLLDPCPAGVPARFVFWSSRPITLAVQLTVALVHQ